MQLVIAGAVAVDPAHQRHRCDQRAAPFGGAGTFEKSLRAIRPMGIVSQIGVLTGVTKDLNIAPILMKHARVQGIYVGSRSMFEDMNRAMVQNKIVPTVDKVFPFDQAVQAYEYLAAARHFGKVVIRA